MDRREDRDPYRSIVRLSRLYLFSLFLYVYYLSFPFIYTLLRLFFFSLKSFSSFPFLLFLSRNFGQSRSQTESTDRRIGIGLVPARKRLLAAGNSKRCRRNERKIYNSKLQLKNNLFETNVNVFKGEKRKKMRRNCGIYFRFIDTYGCNGATRRLIMANQKKKASIYLR